MITEERKLRIMELVSRDGFVSIRQLMDIFGVSRSSVMRDLDELQRQGLIYRQRGGASLGDTEQLLSRYNEPAVRIKQSENAASKRLVCARAASLIRNGSNIYIDSGTTVLSLIDFIMDKEVNIVTPNTLLLSRITERFKGHVILLGGEYSSKLESVSGIVMDEMLEKYNFDCAFLTANGIDFEKKEVYGYNVSYSANKKTVMKRSRSNYLLIDKTKTAMTGFCSWAKTDEFDSIFIDEYEGNDGPDNLIICK